MARTDNLNNFLTDIANAIRAKKGYPASTKISAVNFDTEIGSLLVGGWQGSKAVPISLTTNQLDSHLELHVSYTYDTGIFISDISPRAGITFSGTVAFLYYENCCGNDFRETISLNGTYVLNTEYEVINYKAGTFGTVWCKFKFEMQGSSLMLFVDGGVKDTNMAEEVSFNGTIDIAKVL